MAVEDRTIDDLGLVVLDELHMVEDENRGFLLEILAAKLLSLGQRVQIVGMSATLSVHSFLTGILFELMSVEHRDGGKVAQC
jgi:DNA polymerase theta